MLSENLLAKHGILTRRQVAADLGINLKTLLRYEKEHDFPSRTMGDTTLYDVAQIKKWIASKPKSK